MKLSLIVAMAKNNVIGSNGKIPWHISDDLKYFKTITIGSPLLMGRKTYQSIGSPLPGRTNIIITRNTDFLAEGTETVHDKNSAIKSVKCIEPHQNSENLKIIALTSNCTKSTYIHHIELVFARIKS